MSYLFILRFSIPDLLCILIKLRLQASVFFFPFSLLLGSCPLLLIRQNKGGRCYSVMTWTSVIVDSRYSIASCMCRGSYPSNRTSTVLKVALEPFKSDTEAAIRITKHGINHLPIFLSTGHYAFSVISNVSHLYTCSHNHTLKIKSMLFSILKNLCTSKRKHLQHRNSMAHSASSYTIITYCFNSI